MNSVYNGVSNGVHNGVHNGVSDRVQTGTEKGVGKMKVDSIYLQMFAEVTDTTKTKEQITEAYNKWNNYEEIALKYAPGRPVICAKEFSALFKDRDIKILDAGAGTGLATIELRKLGYNNVDALEPCEVLIKKALERNLYGKWYKAYLSQQRTPIPDNEYDVIFSVGVFSQGQAREDCFEEILRILKPGGHFMVVTGETYLDHPYMAKFEPRIAELANDKKWSLILRKIIPGYSDMGDQIINGIVIVMQKL